MKESHYPSVASVPKSVLTRAARGKGDELVIIEDQGPSPTPPNKKGCGCSYVHGPARGCSRCGALLPAGASATCSKCRLGLRRIRGPPERSGAFNAANARKGKESAKRYAAAGRTLTKTLDERYGRRMIIVQGHSMLKNHPFDIKRWALVDGAKPTYRLPPPPVVVEDIV